MRVLGALLLIIGVLLVGLRVVERVAGGFIGEISAAGLTIVPFHMPIFLAGLVAFALGMAILWTERRHRTQDVGPSRRGGTSNNR